MTTQVSNESPPQSGFLRGQNDHPPEPRSNLKNSRLVKLRRILRSCGSEAHARPQPRELLCPGVPLALPRGRAERLMSGRTWARTCMSARVSPHNFPGRRGPRKAPSSRSARPPISRHLAGRFRLARRKSYMARVPGGIGQDQLPNGRAGPSASAG